MLGDLLKSLVKVWEQKDGLLKEQINLLIKEVLNQATFLTEMISEHKKK
jgi:hypothetical protein